MFTRSLPAPADIGAVLWDGESVEREEVAQVADPVCAWKNAPDQKSSAQEIRQPNIGCSRTPMPTARHGLFFWPALELAASLSVDCWVV